MKNSDDSWSLEKMPESITYDYIKAPDFRVVWTDGVIGGPTSHGMIHCVFFSERPAIPKRQVFKLEAQGNGVATLGKEEMDKRKSLESIVREMACDVFMTPDVAESVATWLLAAAKRQQESNDV